MSLLSDIFARSIDTGDTVADVLIAPDAAKAVVKFNPNHEPAGSPEGGQFASGDGGGGQQWADSLTPAEREALANWTGDGASRLQAVSEYPSQYPEEDRQRLAAFISSLNRAPAFHGVVGRTMALGRESDLRGIPLEVGAEFRIAVPVSATEDMATREAMMASPAAHPGVRVLLEMHLRGGGVAVSAVSRFPEEREVIVKPGMRFRVMSVERTQPSATVGPTDPTTRIRVKLQEVA